MKDACGCPSIDLYHFVIIYEQKYDTIIYNTHKIKMNKEVKISTDGNPIP